MHEIDGYDDNYTEEKRVFSTCFRCAEKTNNGALFCDACRKHLVGMGAGKVIEKEIRKTRFHKTGGKCYAVFFDDKGFVSYGMSDNLYKEFQKWVKADMTPTGERGTYQSDPPTQERIRKMLNDHLAFPF